MADIALDDAGLRRDRQRYHGLLEQAEQQIATWNERADHLQQAIDGLDRLLALAGADPAQDGGMPRRRTPGRGVAPLDGDPAAPEKPRAKAAPAKKPASRPAAVKPPSPTATLAALVPAAASAAEAPKGTDALRVVFEGTPQRAFSLAELIEALETRGWLPTSRRPEEGVRISLKRLAERGGVHRTDDGRWRLAGSEKPEPGATSATWPLAEEPPTPAVPAAEAAPATEPDAEPPPAPEQAPPLQPASFGRPVGGTITEI